MDIYKVDRLDEVVAIYPNIYQCYYDEDITYIRLELILNKHIMQHNGYLFMYEDDYIHDEWRLDKVRWLNKWLGVRV